MLEFAWMYRLSMSMSRVPKERIDRLGPTTDNTVLSC